MKFHDFESGKLLYLRTLSLEERTEWRSTHMHKATFLAREVVVLTEYFEALSRWEKVRVRALAAGIAAYKAVVVGKSAARIWGLPVLNDGPTTLCLPGHSSMPPRRDWFPGTRYVCWRLPESDVTEFEGIRVARKSRVIFDIARRGSLAEALMIMDHVLHTGEVTKAELQEQLERFSSMPGMKKVREALELADGRSESPLESQARAQLIEAEIVDFEIQKKVLNRYRVDILIKGKLVVEIDGFSKYSSEEDLINEKKRSDALINAGYQLLRITANDLNSYVYDESLFIRKVKERVG